MHIHGHGKAADLAQRVKPCLNLIGTGPTTQTAGANAVASSASMLDTARIAKIVGHDGEQNGPVYKITVGRDDLKLKKMGRHDQRSHGAEYLGGL